MELFQAQVDLIREVFMYAKRFNNRRFVIQLSSSLYESPIFPTIVQDLALLHQAGIHVLLIPGAGKQIDEILARYNISSEKKDGIRISSKESISLIKMAAFDAANRLMTQLSSQRVNAVIGNWVEARGIGVRDGVDFQHSGLVQSMDITLLERVMAEGLVPILPCIGWNKSGVPYNVSSIELATELSLRLGAAKLFFVTDSVQINKDDFLLPKEGVTIRDFLVTRLSVQSAREFTRINSADKNELVHSLMKAGARAAEGPVERVHILNGMIDGVIIKEIFSTLGFGTMIHADPFESIRAMEVGDIPAVLRIMEPNINKGILVPRDRDDLMNSFQDYFVYITDGAVRGCGAFHRFDTSSGEIAGIAVDESYSHLGIGEKIVKRILDLALEQKFDTALALTTHSADWFQQLGFKETSPSALPEERRKTYDKTRNSKVLRMLLKDYKESL